MRIGKFALVGGSGILVNEFFLWFFTEIFGFYYLVSSAIAIELSIISNFVLNNYWTFGDRKKDVGFFRRLIKFNSVSLIGMVFTILILHLLTEYFGIYYLISNLIAISIVFVWNYFANKRWTWSPGIRRIPPVAKNPMVSIVIPTYNERENLELLIPEIFMSLSEGGVKGEVIVVDDDSPDGTGETAERMKKRFRMKVIRREGKKGLSSAVLEGFGKAEGEILGVMDADFSHPPGDIPRLVNPIIRNRADMTVGSRKVRGGGTEGWPLKRKIISWGAGLLARPLTSVRDPMSGFFFLKKGVIRGLDLNPTGYKIGLEVMVKGSNARILEVPFVFRERKSGESKLTFREDLRYLFHLIKLYWYKANR